MDGIENKQVDYYRFLSGKQWIADPIQALFMWGPRRALFKAIMPHKPKKLLDVCCGTGAMASRFTSRGIETTGVDASKTMLSRAQEKGRITHPLLMDVSQMQFKQEFDAAYINLSIHEMAHDVRDLVWQKILHAVRKGGIIVAMDLNAPAKLTRSAKFWQGFFELDERNFLQTNPQHYSNYREFIENGGLYTWMKPRVEKLETEHYFFAGNIAVLSAIVC